MCTIRIVQGYIKVYPCRFGKQAKLINNNQNNDLEEPMTDDQTFDRIEKKIITKVKK